MHRKHVLDELRTARGNGLTFAQLERKLAGSVGAATARAMISEAVTFETISIDQLMQIADENCNGRIVSMLEGGYDLEGLSRSVAAHVTALMRG